MLKLTKSEKTQIGKIVKWTCNDIIGKVTNFEILGSDLDLPGIHNKLMQLLMTMQEYYSPMDEDGDDNTGGFKVRIGNGPKCPSPAEIAEPVE